MEAEGRQVQGVKKWREWRLEAMEEGEWLGLEIVMVAEEGDGGAGRRWWRRKVMVRWKKKKNEAEVDSLKL